MEFEIERDDLVDACAARRITGNVGVRTTTAGLLLSVADSTLIIRGTDLEKELVVSDALMGATGGSVLVGASLFHDVVSKMRPGRVHVRAIAREGVQLVVTSGRTSVTLQTLDIADYPSFASPEEPTDVVMVASDLARALKRVLPAASKEEGRPLLTGVLFAYTARGLEVAASDSYRLAQQRLDSGAGIEREAVVPSDSLAELVRHLGTAEKVTIHLGANSASFELPSTTLTTRLIEGEYPKYKGLIPDSPVATLRGQREPLAEAVKRVAVVAGKTTPIKAALSDGGVSLTVNESGVAQSSEVVDDLEYTGEPMTVAFNPGFLTTALECTGGDRVELGFTTSLKPVVVRQEGDGDYLHLVMPVRFGR